MEGFLEYPHQTVAAAPDHALPGDHSGDDFDFDVGRQKHRQLLIISQVVLSMQLSFAIFPLMMFTSRQKTHGRISSIRLWMRIVGFGVCFTSIAGLLNLYLAVHGNWHAVVWPGGALALGFSAWVMFFYHERA